MEEEKKELRSEFKSLSNIKVNEESSIKTPVCRICYDVEQENNLLLPYIKLLTMKQTTNAILMIRPVAFRMNEQTAVNNYYQKVLDGLLPATVNAKAQEEFDAFVKKLRAVGVHVIVVEDTLTPDTPDSIFPNNWISFHENGDVVFYPMFAENRREERREDILDVLEDEGFVVNEIMDYTEAEQDGFFLEGTGSLLLDRAK